MRKAIYVVLISLICGCTTLSRHEEIMLRQLEKEGITPSQASEYFKRPANPWTAGLLNLLPGIGNFYLGAGDGARYVQLPVGVVNLLFWPISVVWGVPQAAVDANLINAQELVAFYEYDEIGMEEWNNIKKDKYEKKSKKNSSKNRDIISNYDDYE